MSLQVLLDGFNDHVTVEGSLFIQWSERGRGFGEYYIRQGTDGKIRIDNECDDKETIKRILCKTVGEAILDDLTFAEIKERDNQEVE